MNRAMTIGEAAREVVEMARIAYNRRNPDKPIPGPDQASKECCGEDK